jgi:predicted nucleic acid-binding protein
VKAVDTSVVIAAFATWHESHARAIESLARGTALPGPCALETYAVLTRLPAPHRIAPDVVRDYLAAMFPGARLALPDAESRQLVETLVERGITGGASYDAVIGLIARSAGATLLTLDERARSTYDRIGAATEYLG